MLLRTSKRWDELSDEHCSLSKCIAAFSKRWKEVSFGETKVLKVVLWSSAVTKRHVVQCSSSSRKEENVTGSSAITEKGLCQRNRKDQYSFNFKTELIAKIYFDQNWKEFISLRRYLGLWKTWWCRWCVQNLRSRWPSLEISQARNFKF